MISMKTTSKQFKELVRAHIVDIITPDDTEGATIEEKLQFVADSFHEWYGVYEQKRWPVHQTAFKEWLMCLPTGFDVLYTNYDIRNTLANWFEACGETYREQSPDEEANLYFHLIHREFKRLCQAHKVEF